MKGGEWLFLKTHRLKLIRRQRSGNVGLVKRCRWPGDMTEAVRLVQCPDMIDQVVESLSYICARAAS